MATKSTTTRETIGRVGQRRQPRRGVDPDDVIAPEHAKIVRRGEAQLKRGESEPWRAVKHDLAR